MTDLAQTRKRIGEAINKWKSHRKELLEQVSATSSDSSEAAPTHEDEASAFSLVESTILALEAALDKHAKTLINLARAHNQRVSINTLPVEIFCTILLHSVPPPRNETNGDSFVIWRHYSRRQPNELQLSHICFRWRSVAVAFPALWSVVDMSEVRPRIAQLYTERAKDHLLDLHFCVPFANKEHADIFNLKLTTIRSLHIIDTPERTDLLGNLSYLPDAHTTLHTLTQAPAFENLPLESLSWTVSSHHPRGGPASPEVLEWPLFNSQTPRLRHLRLLGLRMRSRPGYYVNLHTLHIVHDNYSVSSTRGENICYILRDCPALHTLKLILDSPELLGQHELVEFGEFPEHLDSLELLGQHELVEFSELPEHVHISLLHLRVLVLVMPTDHLDHIIRSINAPHVLHLTLATRPCAAHDNDTFSEALVALCGSNQMQNLLRVVAPGLDSLSVFAEYSSSETWSFEVTERISLEECSRDSYHGVSSTSFSFSWQSFAIEGWHNHTWVRTFNVLFTSMRPFIRLLSVMKFRLNVSSEDSTLGTDFFGATNGMSLPWLLPCKVVYLVQDDAISYVFPETTEPPGDTSLLDELCLLEKLYLVYAKLTCRDALDIAEWWQRKAPRARLCFFESELCYSDDCGYAKTIQRFKELGVEEDDVGYRSQDISDSERVVVL